MRKEIETSGVAVLGPDGGYWGPDPDGIMGWMPIEHAITRHPSNAMSPLDFAADDRQREKLTRGRLVRVRRVTVYEVTEPQVAEYSASLNCEGL